MTPVLTGAHWSDVPALSALEEQIYGPDAWSPSSWWSELAARPRREYIVARPAPGEAGVPGASGLTAACPAHPGGPVLGYAGLDAGGEVADVMTVTLAPAARGRGWGHVLLAWLVERATARGARHLMLEVRDDNAAALALYRSWGFTRIAVRRGYYHGASAYVLRRELPPEQDLTAGGHRPGAAADQAASVNGGTA